MLKPMSYVTVKAKDHSVISYLSEDLSVWCPYNHTVYKTSDMSDNLQGFFYKLVLYCDNKTAHRIADITGYIKRQNCVRLSFSQYV